MSSEYTQGAGLELEHASEFVPLSETGAIDDSLYSDYMRKATYPDGSQAFITFYSDSPGADETGGDPTYAERSLAAERFFANIGMGARVPSHYFDTAPTETDVDIDAVYYLAVEAIEGQEISKEYKPDEWDDDTITDRNVVDEAGRLHLQLASDERIGAVDRDDYLRFAAATLLSGNSDMKGENVMITEDGSLVGIDLDHAAGDITAHHETAEPWKESHYERGIRLLKANAHLLHLDVFQDDIETAASDLAQHITDTIGVEQALGGIPEQSQFTEDPVYAYRKNIRNNLVAFSNADFPERRERPQSYRF